MYALFRLWTKIALIYIKFNFCVVALKKYLNVVHAVAISFGIFLSDKCSSSLIAVFSLLRLLLAVVRFCHQFNLEFIEI